MANPQFQFSKATRAKAKASIQLEGLSGRGKTGLALALGYYLSGKDWDAVYGIDTENNSMPLYVGLKDPSGFKFGSFKICQLDKTIGFAPTNYLLAREAAIADGAKAVISDSISHAWNYAGGVLDLLNKAKEKNTRYAKDSYAAWSDVDVAREKNELLQLVRDSRCHVITTTRVKEKMEYAQEGDKRVLQSLGEQQIMQSEMKYEPDLVLQVLAPADPDKGTYTKVNVTKSRYAIFKKDEEYEMTPALMEQLVEYLDKGVDPEEIFEQQRQEYITAVRNLLDSNSGARMVWTVAKKDVGHENTKLEELPLDIIKGLFIKLTSN